MSSNPTGVDIKVKKDLRWDCERITLKRLNIAKQFLIKIHRVKYLYFFLKMGHSRPLFLYFRLFNTQLTVYKSLVLLNFCRWLDLNRGPLVSEVTALPTEPSICIYFTVLFYFIYGVKQRASLPLKRRSLRGKKKYKTNSKIKFLRHKTTEILPPRTK